MNKNKGTFSWSGNKPQARQFNVAEYLNTDGFIGKIKYLLKSDVMGPPLVLQFLPVVGALLFIVNPFLGILGFLGGAVAAGVAGPLLTVSRVTDQMRKMDYGIKQISDYNDRGVRDSGNYRDERALPTQSMRRDDAYTNGRGGDHYSHEEPSHDPAREVRVASVDMRSLKRHGNTLRQNDVMMDTFDTQDEYPLGVDANGEAVKVMTEYDKEGNRITWEFVPGGRFKGGKLKQVITPVDKLSAAENSDISRKAAESVRGMKTGWLDWDSRSTRYVKVVLADSAAPFSVNSLGEPITWQELKSKKKVVRTDATGSLELPEGYHVTREFKAGIIITSEYPFVYQPDQVKETPSVKYDPNWRDVSAPDEPIDMTGRGRKQQESQSTWEGDFKGEGILSDFSSSFWSPLPEIRLGCPKDEQDESKLEKEKRIKEEKERTRNRTLKTVPSQLKDLLEAGNEKALVEELQATLRDVYLYNKQIPEELVHEVHRKMFQLCLRVDHPLIVRSVSVKNDTYSNILSVYNNVLTTEHSKAAALRKFKELGIGSDEVKSVYGFQHEIWKYLQQKGVELENEAKEADMSAEEKNELNQQRLQVDAAAKHESNRIISLRKYGYGGNTEIDTQVAESYRDSLTEAYRSGSISTVKKTLVKTLSVLLLSDSEVHDDWVHEEVRLLYKEYFKHEHPLSMPHVKEPTLITDLVQKKLLEATSATTPHCQSRVKEILTLPEISLYPDKTAYEMQVAAWKYLKARA
jgi:hypothetical protein